MVRERLGMVLKDASMVLAGKKEAADLCFNLSTETAKFVNDETRWLTLSSTLFFICFIRVLLFQCTPSAVLMISHLHHFASVLLLSFSAFHIISASTRGGSPTVICILVFQSVTLKHAIG